MRTFVGFFLAVVALGVCFGGVGLAAEHDVVLSVGITEKYHDNIFYTADSDNEIDDFITVITGGLKLRRTSERSDAGVSARVEHFLYAEEDDLEGVDQYYTGNLSHVFTSRLKGGLTASYSRDTQPDRDMDATGLVLSTETRDSQKYGGSMEFVLTEVTAAVLSYDYNRQDYDEDAQAQDYSRQQGALLITRQLDKLINNTTGRLNMTYAHYDFQTTDIDYYAGTLGFQYLLSELWYVVMDLGARYSETTFDMPGNTQEQVDGWGGVGSLKAVFQGEYAATSLTLSHDVGAVTGRDGSVERSSAVADMSYRFAEKLRFGVRAGYYLNRSDAGDLSRTEVDERTMRLRPYLRWGITDDLALELSYQYSGLKDEVDDQTRESNMAILSLSYNIFDL